MKVLVDTHAFLWCTTADPRLPSRVREIVLDTANTVLLSAASGWEIALKSESGKLRLPTDPARFVREQLRATGMEELPLQLEHALHVLALPRHHRDPFDRLLIAQCQVEGLPILTADPQIARYDVEVIW